MSLDKAIASGKERRKEYRRSKAVDRSCRNHGSCPYCRANRAHNRTRAELAADYELQEFERNGYVYHDGCMFTEEDYYNYIDERVDDVSFEDGEA